MTKLKRNEKLHLIVHINSEIPEFVFLSSKETCPDLIAYFMREMYQGFRKMQALTKAFTKNR